ncbi:iron permease [Meiothermus granaticius NBRC 107808]|nr:iron permease [Meiothermus granaticius NBRC 107808]
MRGSTLLIPLLCVLASLVLAQSPMKPHLQPGDTATPAQSGEALRSALAEAQLELAFDPQQAQRLLQKAAVALEELEQAGLEFDAQVLIRLQHLIRSGDEAAFARERAALWTGVLRQSYARLEAAVQQGNALEAVRWLELREYRSATRFDPPDADATEALRGLAEGRIPPSEALTAVRADLLDGYQSRLNEALRGLEVAQQAGWRVRGAEARALGQGYFEILAPAYRSQRGEAALQRARALLATGSSQQIRSALEGFRAAPLSLRERARRVGQVLRFVSLVPVEYARGVSGEEGQVSVTKDLEITEALTFLKSAASAWSDLEPLLADHPDLPVIRQAFTALEKGLRAASRKSDPPTAHWVSEQSQALLKRLDATLPAGWRRADPAGDLEVIRSQLRSAQNAVAAGRYDLAELARMDAYALLESGPEARLRVFNPQLALELEGLFWYGQEPKGLARLIRERADVAQVAQTRQILEARLREANQVLGREASPAAIGLNAAIIVFREGLEAVLIIAALLASFRRPENLHLRRPVWLGVGLAFLASALTWVLMWGAIQQFARYGERVEAVVSLIAIGVLLLIMNWFYHKIYWTDRLADFHQQKQQALRRTGLAAGLGLVAVGFESIYREGFETVLFLQSLVLQGGVLDVLWGTLAGGVVVVGLGLVVFQLQLRLPQKKMLIFTGLLVLFVLTVMVGQTVHVMQVVGWLSVTPTGWGLPYWLGTWLGVYPTLEGLLLQVLTPTVVVGSYFAAESLKRRRLQPHIAP